MTTSGTGTEPTYMDAFMVSSGGDVSVQSGPMVLVQPDQDARVESAAMSPTSTAFRRPSSAPRMSAAFGRNSSPTSSARPPTPAISLLR